MLPSILHARVMVCKPLEVDSTYCRPTPPRSTLGSKQQETDKIFHDYPWS